MNELEHSGPFVLYEGDEHNNDYILSDRRETFYVGFDEEEADDLEILLESITHEPYK